MPAAGPRDERCLAAPGAGRIVTGDPFIVRTNCPDRATATRLARTLVDERLAAAANIHAPIDSLYHWRGEVVSRSEVPLELKTRAGLFEALAARIRALHPYETPAVIAVAPERWDASYAAWIAEETRAD